MGGAPLPFFHIPGLQLFLPTRRAILLDSTRYGMETEARWTAEIRCPTECNLSARPLVARYRNSSRALSLKQKSTSTQGWEPRMLLHSPICLLEAWCASTRGSPIVFCHFETASQAASSSWLNTPTECSAVGFAARTRGESHFIRRNCRTPKSATWRTDFARRSSRRTSLSLRSQYRTD